MADPTPTRTETVTANIAAVESKYCPESYLRIITQCIKDISISIATLVDNGMVERVEAPELDDFVNALK
jgi:hypothetical protein